MPSDDQGLWDEIQAQREADKQSAAKLIWSENPQATPEEAAKMIDVARRDASKAKSPLANILKAPRFAGFDPEYERYQEVQEFGPGHPHYEAIRKLVDLAFEPKRKPTSNTNYYKTGFHPKWAPALTEVSTEGKHTFGREMSQRELGYPKK